MDIDLLADHPEAIPVVAKWHWEEWGRYEADSSHKETLESISEQHHRYSLPLAYIALVDGKPVGAASLVEHDMDVHKELTPWLAGVYVDPPFRNHGVASGLVKQVCVKAREIGFERIYLYTISAYGLYAQLGWSLYLEEKYHDRPVKIMAQDL
jgi:GNAT superfamily N-acetyltransferase